MSYVSCLFVFVYASVETLLFNEKKLNAKTYREICWCHQMVLGSTSQHRADIPRTDRTRGKVGIFSLLSSVPGLITSVSVCAKYHLHL